MHNIAGRLRKYLLLPGLVLLALFSACAPATVSPAVSPDESAEPMPTPEPEKTFRIIGYFTDAGIVEVVPFERLTHINYAFLLPRKDGSVRPVANNWKIKNLVKTAHEHQVKVLVSVGGWSDGNGLLDPVFETLAADPVARSALVQNAVAFMQEYEMDGVDIDWEYPDPGESAQNYAALMRELRVALPEGKLLTSAVAALGTGADGIPTEAFEVVDFLNLMVYDGDHGAGHAPMQYALDSLDYWAARGLPQEKTVLGVPFYAHPGGIPYRNIVKNDPAAAQSDVFEHNGVTVYYNGIPTMIAKTKLAMERASGIMFWTLESDSLDETSLLKAIFETAYPQ